MGGLHAYQVHRRLVSSDRCGCLGSSSSSSRAARGRGRAGSRAWAGAQANAYRAQLEAAGHWRYTHCFSAEGSLRLQRMGEGDSFFSAVYRPPPPFSLSVPLSLCVRCFFLLPALSLFTPPSLSARACSLARSLNVFDSLLSFLLVRERFARLRPTSRYYIILQSTVKPM